MLSISSLRLVVAYFSTNKKRLFLFIGCNTISLFFTYTARIDLLCYIGLTIFMIGNFQEDNKVMRKLMLCGSPFALLYNVLIPSPMGALNEVIFLAGNLL
jgi:hypothetical protein